jgi:hypothetical protein
MEFPLFKFVKLHLHPPAAIMLCSFAACASQNHFIGKWSGGGKFSFGSVNVVCDFTPAYVQCKRSDDLSSFGGAYTVKSPTEAVSETASFDFNLLTDGSMTFNNGAITITLHRVTPL